MKTKCALFVSFFMLFTAFAFAQADVNDQIKALKSSRVASALNLNTAESQKFWPLYLNCEEKIYDIKHTKIRQLNAKLDDRGNIDAMSQKEALLYLVQLQAAEEEIFNLRKKLENDLKPIIGPKKILKLKMAEDDFNKMLFNKLNKNKKE